MKIENSVKYYLFGSSYSNVESVYSHLFFVRGWEVFTPVFTNYTNSTGFINGSVVSLNDSYPVPPIVSLHSSNYEIKGKNLLY